MDIPLPDIPDKDSLYVYKGLTITNFWVSVRMVIQLPDNWECNDICVFLNREEKIDNDTVQTEKLKYF